MGRADGSFLLAKVPEERFIL